ncbi:MAG: sporulation protein YqfC [Bacillota bacterium]|nr:sporulation protein YqfC [Bacillota bacterium]
MPERPGGLAGALEEWLELPDDTLLDLPRLTLIGQLMLAVENHRGLVRYAPDEVRIATRVGFLRVGGEELTVRRMDRERLTLAGRITSIMLEPPPAEPERVRAAGTARRGAGRRKGRPWA